MVSSQETGFIFKTAFLRHIDEKTTLIIDHLRKVGDPDGAIHDARREMKKIRAAWRLVRDALGSKSYREKNRYYRDQARRIAGLRDATAVMEALTKLQDRYGSVVYEEAFQAVDEALREVRQDVPAEETTALLLTMAEEIAADRGRINAFELGPDHPARVVSSLVRVYQDGRRLFLRSEENPEATVLHEWRKQAKYLRYQMEFLRPAWPRMIKAVEKELRRLTDLLGDHHDLAVLKREVEARAGILDEATVETFQVLATRRQTGLYQRSLALGRKLYVEDPEAFAQRMKTYLKGIWGEGSNP